MKIYNSKGSVLLDVEVDDSSVRYKAISGDNTVTLNFSLAEHIEIPIGSYCEFKNERYYLMSPENFTMRHRRYFEYSLLMFSAAANAKRYKFINPVDGRLKFPLTAKPVEHLQMIVDNMNLRDGEGSWKVGKCEDHVEIVLSYNHTFCHDALVQLANQLKLDYWYDGNTINVGKLELNKDNPLPLSYGGDGEGLKQDIKRTNYADALPVEVLYVQGSEKNIDPSKYGSSELHLPKGQTLQYDGDFFEDEDGFDLSKARTYIADDKGYSISRADKEISNHSEDSLDCTEIYPTKEETIESVIEVDKEKHFYDILFSSTVDYGQYLIEGEKATIVFQTGMLAGKEFDIATDEDGNLVCKKEGDYWRMEIVPQAIDGITMPDPESGYMPNADNEKDKFKVFNIQLPEEYVSHNSTKSGAEWEMFRYAVKHMYANEDAQYVIAGTLDEIYAKRNWDNISGRLKIGNYISFSDKSFQPEPLLIRITGIREYINKPYSPVLEISNAAPSGTVVGELDRIENQDALNEDRAKSSRQYTNRRFRSSEETLAMLKSAFTNFSEGINPVTVNTIALLVGDESLQFKFTKTLTSLTDAECPLTYDNTTKQLSASSISYIKHMTLGVSAVSSSRVASDFKGWRIPTYSEVLEDTEARYVYIKASKSSTTGAFVISKTAIGMEDVSGYYHFLVGVLNSEYNGMRDFVTLYGFTEVLPGQITTDILRSANGNLVIDLANAVISAQNGAKVEGALVIGSGSSGLTNLSEWSGKQQEIDDAKSAADAAGESAQDALGVAQSASASVSNLGTRVDGIDKSILEINNKLDGVVENYYDDYIPSRYNPPASQWIADETEQEHVGDTFTNTSLEGDGAGKSWRWLEQEDGTYDWQLIADSDATKALALAAEAKAAADGKTKTFLVTPSNYAEGDLWIVGDSDTVPAEFPYKKGTVLYAVASGITYVANNWELYVEYAQRSELEQTVAELDQAIEDAEKASKDYTDEGKAALQESIDALEAAKADAIDVYTKIEADEHINSAEQRAMDAAKDVADAAQRAAETNANAYADKKVSAAEQNAIDTANNNLAAAKQELEAAIAEVDEIANAADAATKTLEAEIGKVKSGLTESVAEINARLDGVVENYFEKGAPALDKKPVTDWIAASEEDDYELINHVGDTYTNIEEYVDDATTPDAGKSWRWCWCDDSSITDKIEVTDKDGVKRYLHWHPIADSDAVKALLEASKAKTAADRKSKTFITVPEPPYSEGDLWVQGKSGDIYRCKTGVDKTSGSFDSSEWELASKYTDDTKANEAMDEAVAAKEVAETAKAATDALNNDGLFTVAEKRSIRKALKDINPAEGGTTLPIEWSVTSKETIEGNAWTEITDKSDSDYGWYVSDMHESDGFTIAKISFRVNVKSDVDVYIKSRAETNYDYTLLSKLDVTLNQSDTYLITARVADTTRGRQTVERKYTFTDVAVGNHFVTVMYRKDSTTNEQPDNGYFKVVPNKFAEGSLGDWMSIVQEKGLDIVICDPAVDAADELFSYLDNTGNVWENVSDEVPEGFRDEVYRLFAAYYKEVSAILVDTATSDLDYLSDAMKQGHTIVENGLVMTSLVAVGDTENPSTANVGAFMNGSDFAEDTEHGKLMHALGIPLTTEDGDEDLEARSKEAKTRMYEDGTIETEKLNAKAGTIANLNITEDGLSQVGENGRTVIELSKKSTIINSSPRYWGRLYEQAILSGSTDAEDANAFFRISLQQAVEEDKIPDKTTLLLIDPYDLETNQSGYAFAVSSGMFAGLRTNTRVITSNKTATSRNTLSRYDFSVLVNTASGTCYIQLPTSPLDGQEYVIESKAAMNITASHNIYQFYSGTTVSQVTTNGKQVLRFKYYAEANQWTCIIMA